VRKFSLSLVVMGSLAVGLGSASAAEVTLGKFTPEQIKSACDKVGGKFSQDAQGYDCGTDCHGGAGTDCIVGCRGGDRCVAQVTGARRPRDILSALKAPPGAPR